MLFVLRIISLGVYFVLACIAGLCAVLARPFNKDNSGLMGALFSFGTRLMGLRVHRDVAPLQSLAGACVIVVNHQSNYDLFVLGSVVPRRTVTIGKKSLKWIPLFGQIYWLSGNVLIDRSNPFQAKKAMLATTLTLQHQNTNIWVFPEGTRNLGQGLKPFKKGAFHMAIHAGVPIVPICVSTYKKHMRLNRWQSGEVIIKALPPISTQGLGMEDLPRLMAQCHAQMTACIHELDAEVSLA